jgi:hypothetical protein
VVFNTSEQNSWKKMKQYRITSENFDISSEPDAILPPDDPVHELKELQVLGGLGSAQRITQMKSEKNSESSYGEEVSRSASEKSRYQKENNINPGTEEWFKLWFSLPYMIDQSKK